MRDSAFDKPHTFCKCEVCGATVRDSRHSETDCETIRLLGAKLAELESPKSLTEEKFQELAQHEWFMRSKTMPKIAPEVFEAIYKALLPHLASAQAAQDHEAIRISVANYVQSEGCGCCQGHNHSEHKKVLAKLLKVPMYSDGSGYDFNAILAAKEQDGK